MPETARQVEQIDDRRQSIAERRRAESARSWLEAYIDHHKLAFIEVARQLGLGDNGRTPVSNFVRGKLESDPTELILAIEQFRALEGHDEISAIIGFRETKCAVEIWKHASDARDNHKMAAVIGYTGYGKTEALKQFQRRTHQDNKPPVRIINCNVLINAPFLARKLALDMGLVEKGGEPAMCLERVMRRLRAHPEFWIVDEANFLQERCLHVFRNIHDVTGAGMLLAGTPVFLSSVANRSGGQEFYKGNDNEASRGMDGPLALFADRVFTKRVHGVTQDEIIEIAQDVLKNALVDKALSKLVFYVARNMRLLTRMLLNLRELKKQSPGRKLDEGAVEQAWQLLQHIGVE